MGTWSRMAEIGRGVYLAGFACKVLLALAW
jgi:hypothetical protein